LCNTTWFRQNHLKHTAQEISIIYYLHYNNKENILKQTNRDLVIPTYQNDFERNKKGYWKESGFPLNLQKLYEYKWIWEYHQKWKLPIGQYESQTMTVAVLKIKHIKNKLICVVQNTTYHIIQLNLGSYGRTFLGHLTFELLISITFHSLLHHCNGKTLAHKLQYAVL